MARPATKRPATKKVTVHLPQDLLERALQSTGKGVTETVRDGLRLVAASDAYRTLGRMRGKVKFSVALKRLREDRS